jgi:hypothetical protein
VNNSPRFAQLDNRLWLGIDGKTPPTLAQITDNSDATPADGSAALAWSARVRSCVSGTLRPGSINLSYLDERDDILRAFSIGALDYGTTSLALFELREQAGQEMQEKIDKTNQRLARKADREAATDQDQFWADAAKAWQAHPGNDPESRRALQSDMAAAAAKAFAPQ